MKAYKEADISELVGKTIKRVDKHPSTVINYDETLLDIYVDDRVFSFHHGQDCCESVSLEDSDGIEEMVGGVILTAEETSGETKETEYGDVEEWTFYRIGTDKGMAVIRFHGSSNGYYSTSVNTYMTTTENE